MAVESHAKQGRLWSAARLHSAGTPWSVLCYSWAFANQRSLLHVQSTTWRGYVALLAAWQHGENTPSRAVAVHLHSPHLPSRCCSNLGSPANFCSANCLHELVSKIINGLWPVRSPWKTYFLCMNCFLSGAAETLICDIKLAIAGVYQCFVCQWGLVALSDSI